MEYSFCWEQALLDIWTYRSTLHGYDFAVPSVKYEKEIYDEAVYRFQVGLNRGFSESLVVLEHNVSTDLRLIINQR